MRQIASVLGDARVHVAVSCVLQVICGALTVGAMVAIAEVLVRLIDPGEVVWPLVWTAVAALVSTPLLHAGSFALSFDAGRRVEQRMRIRLARHVSRIPLGWFTDGAATARLRKGVGPDMAGLSGVVGEVLPMTMRYVTTSVLALIVLVAFSPLLALPVLLVVAVATAVQMRRMGGRTDADADYEAALARLSARSVELGQGIAVAKIYGDSGASTDRFRSAVDEFSRAYIRREHDQERRSLASAVLSSWNSVLGLVVVVGAVLVWAEIVAPTDLIVFLLLSWVVSRSVFAVPTALMMWRRTRVTLRSLDTILDVPELDVRRPAARAPSAPVSVEFDAVSFEYGRGVQVLRDVSLALPAGTTTAFVGRSGSGKSTLVRLLPRFWDPDQGSVLLGGVDVRDMMPEDLNRTVGFVFQDVQLLRRSIAENIALSRPDAELHEIENAARDAQIHHRIVELPRGYDSVFGDDADLSGGEAQRVSIARALLANSPVVVLDEPTSAADPESEAAVLRALDRLTRGRTVLTIAHRLATVAGADRIVVLDEGAVVESGTHGELVAGGPYADMWERERRGVTGPSHRHEVGNC